MIISTPVNEKFMKWLDRFEDHEVCGEARSPGKCPIASCMKALHPWYSFLTFQGHIVVSEPHRWCMMKQPTQTLFLRAWQIMLIEMIDQFRTEVAPVTAGEVRAIMREIWEG